jgi:hypothetical protein
MRAFQQMQCIKPRFFCKCENLTLWKSHVASGLHVEINHKQNVLYGEALCSKEGHCSRLGLDMQGLFILSTLHSFQSFVLLRGIIEQAGTLHPMLLIIP